MFGVDKLDVDFGLVMIQAAALENLASEMETMSNENFEGTLQNIALNWKGDNASLYLAKGNTLKSNMGKTAQDLKDIAEKMKNRAKFIYSKEKNAIDIATQRKY